METRRIHLRFLTFFFIFSFFLQEFESHIQSLCIKVASLDVLIAFSIVSTEFNYVKPSISDSEGLFLIKEGRHPLLELTISPSPSSQTLPLSVRYGLIQENGGGEKKEERMMPPPSSSSQTHFIPNDTFLSSEKRIGFITGPNSSGKSVYLKQVGLICYMAHLGCYVPAERAVISLIDQLFTRISTFESSSIPLSAFAIDLAQISKAFQQATTKSLLLIDEFGKGTTPADGVSLMAASLRHLLTMGVRGLVSTHFHEIFKDGILREGEEEGLICFQMKMFQPNKQSAESVGDGSEQESSFSSLDRIEENILKRKSKRRSNKEEEAWMNDMMLMETPIPLFKLGTGVCSSSHGILCAKQSGFFPFFAFCLRLTCSFFRSA